VINENYGKQPCAVKALCLYEKQPLLWHPCAAETLCLQGSGLMLQRRKDRVSWPVAYAENFHGGGSLSGMRWPFLFRVRCLRRHNCTSYSCFQTNVLAKFVDTMCIFFTSTLLISCVIGLINYQRSRLGYWRKIHSTLRHNSSKLQNIRLRVETGE